MSLQSCRCPCFGHILFIWWNRQVKEIRKFFILNMMLSRRSMRWWLAWRREGGSGWMGLARLCTDLAVYYCVTLWLCDSPPSLSQRKSWWESGRTVQAVSSWGAEAAQAALTTSTVILNNDDCGRAVDELDQNVGWSFRKKMSCCLVWDRRS